MRVTSVKQARTALAEIDRLAAKHGNAPATETNVRTLEQLAANRKSVRAQLARLEAAGAPLRTTTKVFGRTGVSEQDAAKEFADLLAQRTPQLQPGRTSVLRAQTTYPEARQLDDSPGSFAKVAATRNPQTITAAGGLCAPLDTNYDIRVLGSGDRPIRDALNRFQVTHGGIQYRPYIDASNLTAGTWTIADDETTDTDPNVRKAVQRFDCPPTDTASVHGVYSLLEFPNFTARFDPEFAAAALEASMIAAARVSENGLLADILDGSTPVTVNKRLGAARDVLAGMDQAASYFRSRRRLSTTVPLTWIAPVWVRDMLRADIARQQASADTAEALAIAEAQITRWFAARGVNPVWHLDGLPQQTVGALTVPAQTFPAATAEQPLPTWPSSVDTALFQTGDWLYLDGGTLDLGLVRDSELNRRNRYQTFTETFEGTAFLGAESLRVIFTDIEPTGEAQEPITPAP